MSDDQVARPRYLVEPRITVAEVANMTGIPPGSLHSYSQRVRRQDPRSTAGIPIPDGGGGMPSPLWFVSTIRPWMEGRSLAVRSAAWPREVTEPRVTLAELAALAGLSVETLTTYVFRTKRRVEAGVPLRAWDVPPPDGRTGRSPLWFVPSVEGWLVARAERVGSADARFGARVSPASLDSTVRSD